MNNGIDEVIEEKANDSTVDFEKAKATRRPFHYWTVDGKEYKLKLKTSMIEKVEDKYNTNIINLVSVDGIPRLSVMLTIVQAALMPWHHGISYSDVQKMYDKWTDSEGGNQMLLYTRVVMPTLSVSGFFTDQQAQEMIKDMQELEELL